MQKLTHYSLIISTTMLLSNFCIASSNESSLKNATNMQTTEPDAISPKKFTGTPDNTINGKVPPGKIGGINKIVLIKKIDGMKHYVSKMTRNVGLRTAVHYHHYPVTTCVLAGESTFYLDGYPAKIKKAGECFIMPANIKGTNYNSGKNVQILLDFMVLPNNVDTFVPLEVIQKNSAQM